MATDIEAKVSNPEVDAALDKLKKNVDWQTGSSLVVGGLTAGLYSWIYKSKNSTIATVTAASAAVMGAIGWLGAKLHNKNWDTLVNNPNIAERDAALEKQKAPVGFSTAAWAGTGGVMGAASVWYAADYLRAAGKNIGSNGKFAIIASGVALGATIAGGIAHHIAAGRNQKIDALSEALKRQPASMTERIEQRREEVAQAQEAGAAVG